MRSGNEILESRVDHNPSPYSYSAIGDNNLRALVARFLYYNTREGKTIPYDRGPWIAHRIPYLLIRDDARRIKEVLRLPTKVYNQGKITAARMLDKEFTNPSLNEPTNELRLLRYR